MKRLKKFLAVILAVLCITAVTPCTAYADTDVSIDTASIWFQPMGESVLYGASDSLPFSYTSTDYYQAVIDLVRIEFNPKVSIHEGDTLTVTLNSWENGRYAKWDNMDLFIPISNTGWVSLQVDSNYDRDSGVYTFSFTALKDYDYSSKNYWFIELTTPYYYGSFNATTNRAMFKLTSINVNNSTSLEANQRNFFQKIGDWFNSLFEWLKDIRDNAVNGFSNIGTWFTNLGNNIKTWFNNLSDNISGFFSDLVSNIKTQFTNITNNLKEWFSNIGQWFTDIGDRIGDFFERLWNRIWWGNENGESEYQKPVIDNKLNDIIDNLQDYQENLKSTISTINSAAEDVSTYISTGTELVNSVINVAGVGFTALIVFGIVFILVRKVVGR